MCSDASSHAECRAAVTARAMRSGTDTGGRGSLLSSATLRRPHARRCARPWMLPKRPAQSDRARSGRPGPPLGLAPPGRRRSTATSRATISASSSTIRAFPSRSGPHCSKTMALNSSSGIGGTDRNVGILCRVDDVTKRRKLGASSDVLSQGFYVFGTANVCLRRSQPRFRLRDFGEDIRLFTTSESGMIGQEIGYLISYD